MARFSGSSGLRLPPELTMLGKTLLNLDEVARTLHPGFDPNAAIQRDATEILRMRLRASLSPGNFFSGVLEAKELVERLPTRINRILDRLADEKLTVSVEAFDQIRFMQGFQKVANRITLGLVLAALIVGAALLMRVETSFRLLGYPGLAIIFFGIAALGGVALIVSILFDDD
jgi:predicted unusual protein kinase regulating ubiquinone biosynthesis (AarF/ABC1/UbiB family)